MGSARSDAQVSSVGQPRSPAFDPQPNSEAHMEGLGMDQTGDGFLYKSGVRFHVNREYSCLH